MFSSIINFSVGQRFSWFDEAVCAIVPGNEILARGIGEQPLAAVSAAFVPARRKRRISSGNPARIRGFCSASLSQLCSQLLSFMPPVSLIFVPINVNIFEPPVWRSVQFFDIRFEAKIDTSRRFDFFEENHFLRSFLNSSSEGNDF